MTNYDADTVSQPVLDGELQECLRWIQGQHPELTWESFAFVERELGATGDRVPPAMADGEAFLPRFQEILREVDRDWVNLVAVTIRDRS